MISSISNFFFLFSIVENFSPKVTTVKETLLLGSWIDTSIDSRLMIFFIPNFFFLIIENVRARRENRFGLGFVSIYRSHLFLCDISRSMDRFKKKFFSARTGISRENLNWEVN